MTHAIETEHDTLLRELSHRAEISDLLARNWRTMDEKDFDSAAELFTDDIVLVMAGGEPIVGAAEVIECTRALNVPYGATQHNGCSIGIDLDGDRATVHANVIGVLVGATDDVPPVSVTAVGARVGVVLTEQGWRINRIELTPRYRYPVR
ncbi:nuclear transport factor 2 family protein [Kibdelosporangium persicum]|uniref:SnoaL-like domain-containing protein n=1 Tax=Kibdelosporangium persicum TaxID=2698649 RepID=A0ABX2F7V7_9PSEU|nr:nuclear transport factor 2 family protein [Kibdelosporangium persicum]NRN67229.1 SnoaL-like domain-containing protein [Kibdelosporangium persicum]